MNAQAEQMREVAEELIALVGGTIENRPAVAAAPTAGLKKVLSFKRFGKKADTKADGVRTEAVIPLDDRDFKNFYRALQLSHK